jgi:hypothetical protein
MQRLSAPLHGTLGSYLRDALQEGSAPVVAYLPVPRAYVFSLFYSFILAPAGGAAVAAPEGGALAGPSASPHLPVVGAGNPVAVPGLAR